MQRNYDTTGHKPYPRITEVKITYSESGVPSIEYVEQMAVVDGNNEVQHIGANATRHTFDLASILKPVQIVCHDTGLPIDNETVTSKQLSLGLLAFLRADQLLRDLKSDKNEPLQFNK